MRAAMVYASASSDASDRESLIYSDVHRALLAMADLDCHVVSPRAADDATRSTPGQTRIPPLVPVIALGVPAHVSLAETSKRTLIARDLGLEEDGESEEEVIEHLVWSSINTITMVALGSPAWQSIQLLPVARRRFLKVPPLSLCQADTERPSVLVIDHEATAGRASALVEVLDRASFRVRYAGPEAAGVARYEPWADTGWIHVHVGEHTLDTEMPRLVDSWQSCRPTIQLVEPVCAVPPNRPAPFLLVNDRQNGFVCTAANEVVAICRDLMDDPVLRDKVVAIGRSSAAQYHSAWQTIAETLLA